MHTETPLWLETPTRVAWYLRPLLWLARRMTGKDPLPARMLAWSPKLAFGAGLFEALSPTAGVDLGARPLTAARIVASVVGGCPFCVDMNAATFERAGLSSAELCTLLTLERSAFDTLGANEATAARYAEALSRTPIDVSDALITELKSRFTAKECVVLAAAIAQVNFWTRFNQGLGLPAAGFFDESVCRLPTFRARPDGRS